MKKIKIGKNAVVLGKISFLDNCSIYYNTIIRTESEPISFGEGVNIQDLCVIHTDKGYPIEVGDYVTIGHSCIIHGCKIGSNTLIGMGSILMNGSQIGDNCMIGAGSLVTENTIIPEGSLAFGRPAKVIRKLTEEEIKHNKESALHYIELMEEIIE